MTEIFDELETKIEAYLSAFIKTCKVTCGMKDLEGCLTFCPKTLIYYQLISLQAASKRIRKMNLNLPPFELKEGVFNAE